MKDSVVRIRRFDGTLVASGHLCVDGLYRLAYKRQNLGGWRGGKPYKRPRRFSGKDLAELRREVMAFDICFEGEA